MERNKLHKKVEIAETERLFYEISAYHGIEPRRLEKYTTKEISKIAKAMIVNKARERIFRIEELHLDKLKDSSVRDKLLNTILTEISEDYSKSRMLTEDELKRELGQVLG